MSAKDEIIKYCEEIYPAGALMLTGEWGSGKTYLIEKDIKETLKDSHIIVRISLFGISSVDEFNRTVKKRWIDECLPLFNFSVDEKVFAAGKAVLGMLCKAIPAAEKIKEAALAINPAEFICIKPRIEGDDKRVVLAFDDLERSKLDTIDILGCINDYCENFCFHVIVIANEDKIVRRKALEDREAKAIINLVSNDDSQNVKGEVGANVIQLNCSDNKVDDGISYCEIQGKNSM